MKVSKCLSDFSLKKKKKKNQLTHQIWRNPSVMVANLLDCDILVKQVQTPVKLVCSLSDQFHQGRYEPLYPPHL